MPGVGFRSALSWAHPRTPPLSMCQPARSPTIIMLPHRATITVMTGANIEIGVTIGLGGVTEIGAIIVIGAIVAIEVTARRRYGVVANSWCSLSPSRRLQRPFRRGMQP